MRAQTGRWPLSVSADRIAYPAMRYAGLLARIAATGAPAPDEMALARKEGWIHLPDAKFLRRPLRGAHPGSDVGTRQ